MPATHDSQKVSEHIPVAVVTGGTGFVGRNLVSALVGQGTDVLLVMRRDTRPQSTLHPRVHPVIVDGSTRGLIQGLRDAASRDVVVFHLAAYFVAEHSADDVTPLVESNIHFGAQLLEAMAAAGMRRLVFAGTFWQHYGTEGREPACLYAATKQAFRHMAAYFCSANRLQATQLLLPDVYGPGDTRPKLLPALLRSLVEGNRLPMSAGAQALDLLYIDDAVEAFIVAGKRLLARRSDEGCCEDFKVGSGQATVLRDVVSLLEEVAGRAVPVEWGRRPYRAREVMTPWQGGTPLPGWTPRTSLREGLMRTVRQER